MRSNSFVPVFLRVVNGFIFGRRRFCDVEWILYSVVSKYRIKVPSVLTLIRGIRKHSNIQWIKSRTSSFLFFISPGATLCPDRLFPWSHRKSLILRFWLKEWRDVVSNCLAVINLRTSGRQSASFYSGAELINHWQEAYPGCVGFPWFA